MFGCGYVHMSVHAPQKPKGFRSPGDGVMGGCELPCVDARK